MSGTRGIIYNPGDSCPTCGSKEFHFDIHYSFFRICDLCKTKWSQNFKGENAAGIAVRQKK